MNRAFLEGRGADDRGRTLAEIRAFTDLEIEGRHDFIQRIFPLAEPSRAQPGAPVLTGEGVLAIRGSEAARSELIASARWFVGFLQRQDHWIATHDHNHLRISRVIKSLRLLVGDAEADAFRREVLALAEGREGVLANAIRHWSGC